LWRVGRTKAGVKMRGYRADRSQQCRGQEHSGALIGFHSPRFTHNIDARLRWRVAGRNE